MQTLIQVLCIGKGSLRDTCLRMQMFCIGNLMQWDEDEFVRYDFQGDNQ